MTNIYLRPYCNLSNAVEELGYTWHLEDTAGVLLAPWLQREATGLRSRFRGIDSWRPWKFKKSGSEPVFFNFYGAQESIPRDRSVTYRGHVRREIFLLFCKVEYQTFRKYTFSYLYLCIELGFRGSHLADTESYSGRDGARDLSPPLLFILYVVRYFIYPCFTRIHNKSSTFLYVFLFVIQPKVQPTAQKQNLHFHTEPVFLNVHGVQESIPRNEFHQPM